jgi:hypothetical protein
MRTTKELLELMLTRQDLFEIGLCGWVENMRNAGLITDAERLELKGLIREREPNDSKGGYYWETKILKPRIDWIKERIKE